MEYDTIVIGGGLAGLIAAHRLKQSSQRVLVLEASERVGGRVLSTPFGGEAGGESIGTGYNDLLALCDECGIDVIREPLSLLHDQFQIDYYWDGECIPQSEWKRWSKTRFGRPLPSPMMFFRSYGMRTPKPSTFDGDLDSPSMREASSLTVREYLVKHGCPEEQLPLASSNSMMINADMDAMSALNPLLTIYSAEGFVNDGYYQISGGNEKLPVELAKRVGTVRLNAKVSRVHRREDGKQVVETENGELVVAKHVVTAIPAHSIAQIDFAPSLPAPQREALAAIRYSTTMKHFFELSPEFWEEAGSGSVFKWFIDSPFLNITIPCYDWACGHRFSQERNDLWGFYVVSNGSRAESLQKEAASRGVPTETLVQKELESFCRAFAGKLTFRYKKDWSNDPTIPGAFHYYEPSPNIPKYYGAIGAPSSGRWFAGEHTEYRVKGMQAACSSGCKAARDVILSQENKRVVILGCGALGSILVPYLRQYSYYVTATTTTPSKVASLRRCGVDSVLIQKFGDEQAVTPALAQAIKSARHVICMIGPTPGKAKTPEAVAKHYNETLVQPIQAVRSLLSNQHVVFLSSLNVYGQSTELPFVDESSPTSAGNNSAKAYLQAEAMYQALSNHSILRLGILYDDANNSFVNQFKLGTKLGGVSPFDGDSLVHRLRLDDAALAILRILEKEPQGIVNVCEEPTTTVESCFATIAKHEDATPLVHAGYISASHVPIRCIRMREAGWTPTPTRIGNGEEKPSIKHLDELHLEATSAIWNDRSACLKLCRSWTLAPNKPVVRFQVSDRADPACVQMFTDWIGQFQG